MAVIGDRASIQPPWKLAGSERPAGLALMVGDTAYVLPWIHHIYATGTNDEVVAVWTSHKITVRGSGLAKLLQEFAWQRLIQISRSPRTEKFYPDPVIESISIEETEE